MIFLKQVGLPRFVPSARPQARRPCRRSFSHAKPAAIIRASSLGRFAEVGLPVAGIDIQPFGVVQYLATITGLSAGAGGDIVEASALLTTAALVPRAVDCID